MSKSTQPNYLSSFIRDFNPDIKAVSYQIFRDCSHSLDDIINYVPTESIRRICMSELFKSCCNDLNQLVKTEFISYYEISKSDVYYAFSLGDYLVNNYRKLSEESLRVLLTNISNPWKLFNLCITDLDYSVEQYSLEYEYNKSRFIKSKSLAKFVLSVLDHSTVDFHSLKLLYCRGDVGMLGEIEHKTTSELLQWALIYGRNEVLSWCFDNDRIKGLSNPFKLSILIENSPNSVDDIWNGWNWFNDECDKPFIGEHNWEKCFNILFECGYNLDGCFKQWLNLSQSRNNGYQPHIESLLKFFMTEPQHWTREQLVQNIERFGKRNIWDVVRKQCNADFLDLVVGFIENE